MSACKKILFSMPMISDYQTSTVSPTTLGLHPDNIDSEIRTWGFRNTAHLFEIEPSSTGIVYIESNSSISASENLFERQAQCPESIKII